jgi:alanine-glyoxylate transaminase/serine-glyoxylate transaminase/serine-pyruvate transaminase
VAALVVHLETSTAVLNPIRDIAAVARKYNRLLMVDGVSSIGGAEFDMDGWGVDVCGTAPQKGLGAPPGVGIVAVGERAWERICNQPERLHSWYLDLRRWNWYAENWASWHPTPVTMPTSLILALRASLRSLVAETLPARLRRYSRLAERLRTELEFLGFPLFVPRDRMAPVLTAARCPEGVTSHEVIRFLAEHHNIQITAGFGAAKDSVIRIGHMGGAVNDDAIDRVLDGLSEFAQMRALNALMPL